MERHAPWACSKQRALCRLHCGSFLVFPLRTPTIRLVKQKRAAVETLGRVEPGLSSTFSIEGMVLCCVVIASRLTCRPDAFLGSVFVLAVSKLWSTTCVFLEFLSIYSLLCLFVLAGVLILLALRFCSFQDRNSRFCCFLAASF